MFDSDMLKLIISGHYSDWFFNVFLTNIGLTIKNNIAVLLLFAGIWVKISKLTETKVVDKASNWLMKKLTGGKNEST